MNIRLVARAAVAALVTTVAAVLLAISTTMTSVMLAATALIMGGTDHPLSVPEDTPDFIESYVNGANDSFIANSGLCGGGTCTLVAAYTPEQFPLTGLNQMMFDQSVEVGRQNLDNCIRAGSCIATKDPYTQTNDTENVSDTRYVVYGYSQSGTVATVEKRHLKANPPPAGTDVFFIVSANPNRPHGGALASFPGLHIPFLGVTFNGAMPTDTNMLTIDVARQYDLTAEVPTNPLNLVALLNGALGAVFLHPNYYGLGEPELQGQYGDTTYYLFPTPVLPLLMPLEWVPFVGPPLAVTFDPFFRVLAEAGYNRTINPGQPTPVQWLYHPDPISTVVNLAVAVPTGLDNGISYFTGNRPFGTAIPGPYGVGGPPVNAGCVGPNCGAGPTPYAAVKTPSQFDAAFLRAADPKPNNDVDTPTNVDVSSQSNDGVEPQSPTPGTRRSITRPTGILSALSTATTTKPPTIRERLGSRPHRVRDLVHSLAGAFDDSARTKPLTAGDGTPEGSN